MVSHNLRQSIGSELRCSLFPSLLIAMATSIADPASAFAAGSPDIVLKEGITAGNGADAISVLQTITISDGQTLSIAARLANGQSGLWTSASVAGWKTPLVNNDLPSQRRGTIWESSGSAVTAAPASAQASLITPWAQPSPASSTPRTSSTTHPRLPPTRYFWECAANRFPFPHRTIGTVSPPFNSLPAAFLPGWGRLPQLPMVFLPNGESTVRRPPSNSSLAAVIWRPRLPSLTPLMQHPGHAPCRMSASGTRAAAVCSVLDGSTSRCAVVTKSLSDSLPILAARVGSPLSSQNSAPKWKDLSFAIPSDVNPCTGGGKLLIVGKLAATQFDDSVVVMNDQILLREGATIGGWVLQGNVFDASMNGMGDWAAVWQVHSVADEAVLSTALILNGEIILMPGATASDRFATSADPPMTITALTADVEVAARVPGEPVPVFVIVRLVDAGKRAVVLVTGGPNLNLCCAADFNHDNLADFNDYLDFLDAFATEDPSGDFNGDSVVDFSDYLDFVDALSVGC